MPTLMDDVDIKTTISEHTNPENDSSTVKLKVID
jgi:hypothetical protein